MKNTTLSVFFMVFIVVFVSPIRTETISTWRRIIRNNASLFVFGDSSVDAGNNNVISTELKVNFPPYGVDFPGHRPTGRFSNGKLATDFIAAAIGQTQTIPAFLDPEIKKKDLIFGACFASGGSGYDELTANISKVLSMTKQIHYFKHHKLSLMRSLGTARTQQIMENAIFVISSGSNDFIRNYYLDPIRPKQFTVQEYHMFLASQMEQYLKELERLGARKVVLVGLPPFGCLPIVMALNGDSKCVEEFNNVAAAFNDIIKKRLVSNRRITSMYIDTYGIIMNVIQNPNSYDIEETSKGCCGSGTVEFGDTCKGLNYCSDRSKFVFWDAIHPTEKIYKIIADEVLKGFYN